MKNTSNVYETVHNIYYGYQLSLPQQITQKLKMGVTNNTFEKKIKIALHV